MEGELDQLVRKFALSAVESFQLVIYYCAGFARLQINQMRRGRGRGACGCGRVCKLIKLKGSQRVSLYSTLPRTQTHTDTHVCA